MRRTRSLRTPRMAWTGRGTRPGLLAPQPVGEPVGGGLEELQGEAWPPGGAQPLDVEDLYERLGDAGFGYGPVFQGVRTAWRDERSVFVEVALGEQHAQDAERFGVHPALFDAAFHAAIDLLGESVAEGQLPLPFSWGGVRLYQHGARTLRVRLGLVGEGEVQVAAVEQHGAPVLAVNALQVRPVDPALLRPRAAPARTRSSHWSGRAPGAGVAGAAAGAAGEGGDGRGVVVLGGLELDGVEPQARHVDLGALREALDGGVQPPSVVCR